MNDKCISYISNTYIRDLTVLPNPTVTKTRSSFERLKDNCDSSATKTKAANLNTKHTKFHWLFVDSRLRCQLWLHDERYMHRNLMTFDADILKTAYISFNGPHPG